MEINNNIAMKISKTFKKALKIAAEELKEWGQTSLNQPFQDNYVTLEKPQQTENVMELKFRELEINRDGSFFLVMKIM